MCAEDFLTGLLERIMVLDGCYSLNSVSSEDEIVFYEVFTRFPNIHV